MPLNKVTVCVILGEKAPAVFCVSDSVTVAFAVSQMNNHRVGSMLVKNGARCVGIFTERDVLTRVVARGLDASETKVRDVMTKDFRSISQDTSVEDAMQLMTDKRVRHLPIMDGESLVGMVSIGDITRWLLKINELEAENLRRYVFSEYPG